MDALGRMRIEDLSSTSGCADNTTFESLRYCYIHEVYHIGQLTMVAEALGKRAEVLSL